ncbi:hypothetical protein ES288_D04G004600v1, partial [Gossypium darwinii]
HCTSHAFPHSRHDAITICARTHHHHGTHICICLAPCMPFAEPIEHRWPPWMAYEEPSIYSMFFLPLLYMRISRYFIFLFNLNISFYAPPPTHP